MNLFAHIRVRDLDVSFDAAAGKPLVLVGPNGAGKTTILRTIAGLERVEAGSIQFGDTCFDGDRMWVSPERRSVGYVPQQRSLFPHLNVLDNVAFSTRDRAAARVWLQRAEMETFEERFPTMLSGGERARVALLRALASEPKILLLDEPFSDLDATARIEMRRLLQRTLEAFNGVALLVTHDPIEALSIDAEIAVIENGRITQRADASALVTHPRTAYIARFFGLNLLHGKANGSHVRTHEATIIIAEPMDDGDVIVSFPASAVALSATPSQGSARNVFQCVVREIADEGARVRIALDGPLPLTAEVTRSGAQAINVSAGALIYASIKATEIQVEPA